MNEIVTTKLAGLGTSFNLRATTRSVPSTVFGPAADRLGASMRLEFFFLFVLLPCNIEQVWLSVDLDIVRWLDLPVLEFLL